MSQKKDVKEGATSCATTSLTRKITECALGVGLPLYCTIVIQVDDPSCRTSRLITLTTITYGILYGILRKFNRCLQPPLNKWVVSRQTNGKDVSTGNNCTNFRNQAASEWRSRLLAIVNALILTWGSLRCFKEWPTYLPESEGWIKTVVSENENNCFWSNPITFASLFVGYLQWDLCWLIWHRTTHPDIGSLIHHSIFIAVTHFVLSGTYFRKPYAWLSLTEVSTPFLHGRWFLAATGQKHTQAYQAISVGFALTFLSTRSIGYGLGLFDVWRSRKFWESINGLWGVIIGLHLAYVLNLFWSIKVASALGRVLFAKSKRS